MTQPVSFQGFPPEAQAFASSPKNIEKVIELADRCRLNPDLPGRLNRKGDEEREKAFADFGVDDSREWEIVFIANTERVEHFVIPPDPNVALGDEQLDSIAGGSTASTAGTLGTGSTVLTFTSFSSLSSAACAGCAGSAG